MPNLFGITQNVIREERKEKAWLAKRYDEENAKAGLWRTKGFPTSVLLV